MERVDESANGNKNSVNDPIKELIGSTATANLAKARDAMETVPVKMAKPVSNIPGEPVPSDDEGQLVPVEVINMNSPKFHSSNRSNPTAPATLVMERQRTHTVMTVDQNLRAGFFKFFDEDCESFLYYDTFPSKNILLISLKFYMGLNMNY
jgi:hypothetical protein